jgi:hypothetical protein
MTDYLAAFLSESKDPSRLSMSRQSARRLQYINVNIPEEIISTLDANTHVALYIAESLISSLSGV